MKKGLLFLSIVLLLAGGVAMAWGADLTLTAAAEQRRADADMAKVNAAYAAKDALAMKGAMAWMEANAQLAHDLRDEAKLRFGAGALLLAASAFLFSRSRRARTVARA